MELGAFSVSLSVRDINVSKAFYEKFGFVEFGGDIRQDWLILKNGDHIIGLFQGMFNGNILTFNPGWDQNAQEVDNFSDVREIQKELLAKGVTMIEEADLNTSGPASITFSDPDGNTILIDQQR